MPNGSMAGIDLALDDLIQDAEVMREQSLP
jgi:hypothetical protein